MNYERYLLIDSLLREFEKLKSEIGILMNNKLEISVKPKVPGEQFLSFAINQDDVQHFITRRQKRMDEITKILDKYDITFNE